eukprot:m.116409 g.116409  ORF g.116409 m.116409 type:complete len:1093 (-) comp16076_c1_seq1:125-3403(-)
MKEEGWGGEEGWHLRGVVGYAHTPPQRLHSFLLLSSSFLGMLGQVGLQAGLEGVADGLCVAEEHVGVGLEEDRVVDVGVACAEGALHDDDLLGVPDGEDGHAGNGRIRVVQGGGVDRVVGADDEGDVSVGKVVVDLLHLQDNVVGHVGLGQQDVELARHAAGHRVDAKAHLDAALRQHLGNVGNGVLGLGHGQAVAGHNDHALGVGQHLHRLLHVGLGVRALHLHGLAAAARQRGDAAENHVDQRAVHGHAHDVGENGAGRANQRADNRQQVVVQHKALGAERPAAVRVEHGDDHRHVRAADRGRHVRAEHKGGQRACAEAGHADCRAGRGQEEAQGADVGQGQGGVAGVAAGQGQRLGLEQAVQLAKGHHRASQRHAANEGGQEDRRAVHSVQCHRVAGVVEKVREGRGHGGEADQAVEAGHQLRQVGDGHALGNDGADAAADSEAAHSLGQGLRGKAAHAERRNNARGHADDAEGVADASRLLRGQTPDAADAADRGGQQSHLRHLGIARGQAGADAANKGEAGDGKEIVVLLRVSCAAEHVEHALGDEEAADNVDGRGRDGEVGQQRGRRVGKQAAAEQRHAANRGRAGNSVGHRHERRVQRRGHAPDDVVADNAGQRKGAHHGRERRAGRRNAKAEQCADASSHPEGLAEGGGVRVDAGELLLEAEGLALLGLGRGRAGHLAWGRGPDEGAVAQDDGAAGDLVLHVDAELVLDVALEVEEVLGHVVGEESRGLGRQAAGHVAVAEDAHALVVVELAGLGQLAVAARLGRQINHHRAFAHAFHHVLGDELGRRLAGDERRGDDNVDLTALLGKQGHLGVDKLLGHLLGVAALARAADVLKARHLQELAAERLDLLLDLWAGVEAADDRAHVLGRARGCQTGDTAADDEDLGRRDLARSGDLAGEEAAKLVGGLDDGAVAGDVGHGAEHVKGLGAAGARDAVHGKGRHALLGQRLDKALVLRREEHAHQDSLVLEQRDLVHAAALLGRPDLHDHVLGPGLLGRHDLGAGRLVLGIGEVGACTGILLDEEAQAECRKGLDVLRDLGHTTLARTRLLRHAHSEARIGLASHGFLRRLGGLAVGSLGCSRLRR